MRKTWSRTHENFQSVSICFNVSILETGNFFLHTVVFLGDLLKPHLVLINNLGIPRIASSRDV